MKRAFSEKDRSDFVSNKKQKKNSNQYPDYLDFGLYTRSEYDYREKLIAIRKISFLGQYGVFAEEKLDDRCIIGEYVGKRLKVEELDLGKHKSDYTMDTEGKKIVIDAEKEGNFTRFINHSEFQANVYFSTDGQPDRVYVYAKRDIKPGEQLLIDYNYYQGGLYFLNSDDPVISIKNYVEKSADYGIFTLKNTLNPFNLAINESVYVHKALIPIFRNQIIKVLPKKSINSRIFKLHKNQPMELNDFDAFTPLMLACFLGHKYNSLSLIEAEQDLVLRARNINTQQIISGKTALYFAIDGFKDNPNNVHKPFLEIITNLINHGALILIQNKNSQSVISYAIEMLPEKQCNEVLRIIIDKIPNIINDIALYIDNNDFDIYLTAMKYKKMESLLIILNALQNHINQKIFDHDELEEAIRQRVKFEDVFDYTRQEVQECLKEYTADELEYLVTILKKFRVPEVIIEYVIDLIDEAKTEMRCC